MELENVPPATTGRFVSYGMPRLSTSALIGVIDFGLLGLYTLYFGVDAFLAGFALAMGKLAIAASQFLMGWLSDKTNTRIGRRKPFMIVGAPVLALTFIFLLLPTTFLSSPGTMTLFFWMLIFNVLFQFFYGELTTPYQSWMAEQFIVHDRPRASVFQNMFGFLGTAAGIVAAFLTMGDAINTDLPINERVLSPLFIPFMIVLAILVVALYYFCAYVTPVEQVKGAESNFIKDIKDIARDKNFIKVCFLQGIAFLAWGMITSLLFPFVQNVLGLTGNGLYIGAGVLFLGVILFLFTWKKFIDLKGKKQTISIIFLFATCVLPFSLVGLIPGDIHLGISIAITLGIAGAMGGWYLFPYIWYADLAEDAKRRGDLKEIKAGLYAGFPNIILNIFQAASLFLMCLFLSLPNVPGKGYSYGYVIWGVWCSIIMFIGFLFIKKYIKLDFEWEKDVKKSA